MALEHKDRVKDQTSTTGTGSFTLLSSAPTGFRTFTSAFTDGARVRYSIANSTQAEWEVGEGVWNSATLTLARDTVYASSNAGALTNFSVGTKNVTAGPVAADISEGATKVGVEELTNKTMVNPSAKYQTLTDASTVNWDCEGGQLAYLTLGGSRSMALPTNMKPGMSYFLFLIQDSAGSRQVYWDSGYRWAAGLAPTLSSTPNNTDIIHMMSDGTNMYCSVFALGVGQSGVTPPQQGEVASLGFNLSGMENLPGMRTGLSTQIHMHWAVPRASDIATIASWGFPRNVNRLPFKWEMLQPVLLGSPASATVLTAEGVSTAGALHPGFVAYIRAVLDAHEAAGTKVVLDLHNYCRYRDFIYQGDGSVTGYTNPTDGARPYTAAANTKWRIFAKVTGGTAFDGTTISQAQFNDVWVKLANEFKNHAGLGGYGLMNEPHDMPAVGGTVEQFVEASQDLTIWTDFAKNCVDAIRAVDANTPIYVGGNNWSQVMNWQTNNPAFPFKDGSNVLYPNIVYEGHVYADSRNSGTRFDWDTEAANGYSVGESGTGITTNTMYNRVVNFVEWCNSNLVKGVIGEAGMPTNEGNSSEDRWASQFKIMTDYLYANGVGVMPWSHATFWYQQNWPINATINWHNNQSVQPTVAGLLKNSANAENCQFFASAERAWGVSGTVLTIRVWGRGNLTSARTFNVTSDNGGTLSSAIVTMAAGWNPKASFTYTTASERTAVINFTGVGAPWPVTIFSQSNPAGITNVATAALAICAKYDAAKWEMPHAYDDYAGSGTQVLVQDVAIRAVRDSGYATKQNNIYDMKAWWTHDLPAVAKHGQNLGWLPPTSALINTKVAYDGSKTAAEGTTGLWCRKRVPVPTFDPTPLDDALYNLNDSYFQVVAFRAPAATPASQDIFAATHSESGRYASIRFDASNNISARIVDGAGTTTNFTGSTLTAAANHTASFRYVAGGQVLRANGTQVASGTMTVSATTPTLDVMNVGIRFSNYYINAPFRGQVFGVVTGKGAPTDAELAVLETYLATLGA